MNILDKIFTSFEVFDEFLQVFEDKVLVSDKFLRVHQFLDFFLLHILLDHCQSVVLVLPVKEDVKPTFMEVIN